MSKDMKPMTLREARIAAEAVIAALRPYVTRIEVAGSIRRCKAWCNDVEIVCIPKTTPQQVLVREATLLEDAVYKTEYKRDPGYAATITALAREIVRGVKLDEAKTTQFIDHEGHTIDIFTAHPDNWGYIFVIRTGSPEYSQGLLGKGNRLGYKGVEGMWTRYGKPVPVREEADMFGLLGIKVTDPRSRG